MWGRLPVLLKFAFAQSSASWPSWTWKKYKSQNDNAGGGGGGGGGGSSTIAYAYTLPTPLCLDWRGQGFVCHLRYTYRLNSTPCTSWTIASWPPRIGKWSNTGELSGGTFTSVSLTYLTHHVHGRPSRLGFIGLGSEVTREHCREGNLRPFHLYYATVHQDLRSSGSGHKHRTLINTSRGDLLFVSEETYHGLSTQQSCPEFHHQRIDRHDIPCGNGWSVALCPQKP